MDLIERQAAIDALNEIIRREHSLRPKIYVAKDAIKQLPPAQQEIIYCKDCAKHNRALGEFLIDKNGERRWFWKGESCPLVEYRGKAQGHEFDYQYCACAERRING